jgi:hypothetical protein
MTSVIIDIDLNEFDDEDIIEYLKIRVYRNLINEKDLQGLKTLLFDNPYHVNISKNYTLEDLLKDKHFAKVRNKYSSAYIEQALPE